MRILHTAHSYYPEVSGVPEVVSQISSRLASKGHDVHVATGLVSPSHPQEEIINGVHVHRFKVKGNAVKGITGEFQQYRKYVLSQNWDILGMHCAQIWSTDSILSYLDKIRGKKVFISHGLSAWRDSAYDNYFNNLSIFMKRVNRIVSLSEMCEEKDFCLKFGLPLPLIINNGVDIAKWEKSSVDLRSKWNIGGHPWVLSISNHNPVKGHFRFFKVIDGIRKYLPGTIGTIIGGNYPAAAFGLGEIGVKGGCWYRCRFWEKMKPYVSLRSGLNREEVISAIHEADLVLTTSRWEASPLVVLESMAARTPWISFDVGCVREHVGGFVVNSDEEMASLAVDLLKNPSWRETLGEEGRSRIITNHDWDGIAEQYERLYESLIKDVTELN